MQIRPVDIDTIMKKPVPQVEYVLPGLRPGRVGVLSAPGGTGKSFLLLELAFGVATGEALIPSLPVGGARRVVFLTFEEDMTDLHFRIHALQETFPDFFDKNRDAITENIAIYPLMGHDIRIYGIDGKIEGGIKVVKQVLNDMEPGLVIVDPFAQIHSADENANAQMSNVMRLLTHFAQTYDCAILISHHSSKASVLNGNDSQQSSRGASAIIDNARWGAVMYRPKNAGDYEVNLRLVKLNNHAPIQPINLRRRKNGALIETKVKTERRELA